jgi:hypothetical protein
VQDAEDKLVEWETKLVALSNAKDKAAAAAAAGAMEKEKLNGSQLVAEQHKNEVADAAKVEIPPYDKEIYVIQMIKKKVLSFASTCGECVSHSLPSSMPCVTQCHSALCSTGSDGLTFGG